MPDKKREEFFIKLFLEDYNSHTGKHYTVVARPDDEREVTGTYDFLCKDNNSTGDYLAVEEKSLNKCTENVRDNKEIQQIVCEVKRILDEKGILCNDKGYRFFLELKNAPPTNERRRYAQKIAECVEQTVESKIAKDIQGEVTFNVEGYDCIKRFRLMRVNESRKVEFYFAPESNESRDLLDDTFNAVARILENSNSKLKIPKEEGKRVILLITNDWNNFVAVDERNIREAMESIEEQWHKDIDEIFFINKRSLEPGYAISKIK